MTRAPHGRSGSAGAWRVAHARYVAGVVALGLLSAIVGLAAWAVLPALAPGWAASAVTSESMAPVIRTGDVIVTATPDPDRLEAGNVVVFTDTQGQGTIAHRIVEVRDDGTFATRGDANGIPDSTPLEPERIEGVGRLAVPLVGFPTVWLGEAAWGLLGLAVALVLLLGVVSRFALLNRYDPWLSLPPEGPPPAAPEGVVLPAPGAPPAPAPDAQPAPSSDAPSAPSSPPPPPMPRPTPAREGGTALAATSAPPLDGRLWVAHPYRRRPRLLRATSALTSLLLVLVVTGGTATARFTDTSAVTGSWTAGSWAEEAEDLTYYLKAGGEGDQDAQLMLPMSMEEPTQDDLPDYSQDLTEDRPGRLLVRDGGDPAGFQIWTRQATEEAVLHGELDLTLWAKIFEGVSEHEAAELEIGAFGCSDLDDINSCVPLGDTHTEGFVTVYKDSWGTEFVEVTASFGSVEHTLEAGHHLGVAVLVGGDEESTAPALSLAYDTVDYPSRLTIEAAPAPATPTNLQVTGTSGSTVDLEWVAVDDADAYRVRHREAGTDTWTETETVEGTTMTVDGLAGATTYELQVRAEHLSGASAWSPSVPATTSAGSTVQLADGGPAGVIGPGLDFHVYVRSDGTEVTADLSEIVDAATDVPLESGGWDVDGVTYTHRSESPLTADDPLADGEHDYSVTIDGRDPEEFTLTVDTNATVQPPSNLEADAGCTTLPIEYRSHSTLAQGNQNSRELQVARPAGVSEGDLLLAAFNTKNTEEVPGAPDGWTRLGSDGNPHVYYKVAGAGEPAGYPWTVSRAAGAIVAYAGVHPTEAIDAYADGTGTSAEATAPEVTTSVDDGLLVALFGFDHRAALTTPPAGMDPRWNHDDGGGQGAPQGVRAAGFDEQLGAEGATGGRTAQADGADWWAAQVALRPAGLPDGEARVDLSWEATPSAFADGYVLERWHAGELDETWELTDPGTTEFTDHPSLTDTTYTYRLRAVAGDWTSDEIESTVTTPACQPAE